MQTVHVLLFGALMGAGCYGQAQPPRQVAPVPSDAHELVSGVPQVPATPADRATAFALLEKAKQNSDLHMPGTPPFSIRIGFNATGNVSHTGPGEIRETWLSGRSWRYDQNLGSYSETRIGQAGQTYATRAGIVPLRIQMLRVALFWPIDGNPSVSTLRTAAAEWKGKPVTCLLTSGSTNLNEPGRHWEETEYCLDNASGLMQIYSRAPGTYVVYGYTRTCSFTAGRCPTSFRFSSAAT